MGTERIYLLLKRYRDNLASDEEVRELFRLMKGSAGQAAMKELMAEDWLKGDDEGIEADADWARMWTEIRTATEKPKRAKLFVIGRMRAAAILVFCLGTGVAYWFLSGRDHGGDRRVTTVRSSAPIVPGGNKAVLTLGDGSTISLDSVKDGILAQQGSSKVVKVDAGVLAYDARNKKDDGVMFNTIATPYGGQYQVVLPDGSKVWLNAASSLRFPTVFTGAERRVELTGEGYFEIAGDAQKPFVVHAGSGEDVQVLGTSFNIMAYENEEESRTTLVSGKVRVTAQGGAAAEVEPGRQAVLDHEKHGLTVSEANVDQAIAWKNGLFRFHETGIRELMRQVERWYNVEVVYRTDGTDQDFSGIVSRSKSIGELLHTLEMTNSVHFRIEGRKIIVLP
ncbi:MAG TPA: FecR domain-containing protein [Puia sp.]|uniref:FecR family protein n=1 Tax=Puia sp. TaxID=2045100 RepID=UPI002D121D56|nr:FecR domain-containing protein [Puia sp.]HVU95784.1 FecR domain-containing protein [Puia sp.]